jgi:hypothetical protein
MLQPHPISDALGPVLHTTLETVTADVATHGQECPIVLHEGMIWDGRARYLACEKLGIKPWLVPLRRKNPVEYYICANITRVGEPNSPERKKLVRALAAVEEQPHRSDALARRRKWLNEARADFQKYAKGKPEPCAVCNDYIAFVNAHHCFPLLVQYECSIVDPIHEHKWLCPVHHKLVHVLLSGYLTGGRDLSFLDCIPDHRADEWNALQIVAQIGFDLCCDALGRTGTETKHRRYDPPYGLFIAVRQLQYRHWPKQEEPFVHRT